MEAKLVVIGGKANKAEVQLKLPTVIGRGRDADLTVAHPTVSRHHCVLFEQAGVLFVRDNGSLNGTLIDGNKIQESQLKPGETLTVGPLTFRADYHLANDLPDMPDTPADHLAETTGSAPAANGASSEETIQFEGAAAIGSPLGAVAESAPKFDFLAAEPAVESPPDDAPPADSLMDLGPAASMDDDVIDFLDEKPTLPPTAVVEPATATRTLAPAASTEFDEFALAPTEKKPADVDEEVLAMLGGNDQKPSAKHVDGVPEIKFGDDGKSGSAAAQPAAGDDELNDFFQSLGVK